MINLEKDLVFFDVETTGLHVIRDRILQLAMIKYSKKNGPVEEMMMLINPGIPISEEAMRVHGITPADLVNKPVFAQVAQKIFDFIGDADLAGYNSNRFDIPILMEELARCGFDLEIEKRRQIDVQRIFYKMEPRTLKAAYQFYCGSPLEGAHDALEDVRATIKVLEGQLEKYESTPFENEDGTIIEHAIKNDVQSLHDFTNDMKTLDATQRLKFNEKGEIVFNFGKYIGQVADKVLYEDRNYYHWIQEKEFSFQLKKIVKQLLKDYEQKLNKK